MQEDIFRKEKLKKLQKKIPLNFPKELFTQEVIIKVKEYRKNKKPWYLEPIITPLQLALAALLVLALGIPLYYLTLEIKSGENTSTFSSKKVTQKVVFSYYSKEKVKVELLGDFNSWQRGLHILQPVGGNKYEIVLDLPPGRYQYIFLINDQFFQVDPLCKERVEDGYGNLNSVLAL